MIVAIHQPNFFPWAGFFRKVALADVFVFLDAVPYPRTSRGTWINRSRLLCNGAATWFTCPVAAGSGGRPLHEVRLASGVDWRRKLLGTLHHHYGRHPYAGEYLPKVQELIVHPLERLADFNEHCIRTMTGWLGLDTHFVRQSEMQDPDIFLFKGSARLAAICQELDADVYLAGDGSGEYEDERAYARVGVKIKYSNFSELPYKQKGSGTFVAGLSMLDALFNLGPELLSCLELDR